MTDLHTPTSPPLAFQPAAFTVTIWRGTELAFVEEFDNLTVAVQWTSRIVRQDRLAGYLDTSANIVPKGVES